MGGADDICPIATPLGMENGSMFTVTSSKLLCRWQEHFLQNSTGLAGKTRQTNTYKVKMTTWFKSSERQSSISIRTHPDDHIIQRCTKSKSLLHILLWVSRALASYNRQSFQNMELQKQNHYYLTWDTDVHQSWAMLGQQWHP